MTFTAKLRRPSAAWKAWHDNNRPGGTLYGVAFRRASGGDYVAGPLELWQVEALQGHRDVILETSGVVLPETEPEPEADMSEFLPRRRGR